LGEDSGFKFVNSLIESKTAIPFTARATAPTVTLPRIKALTTGTIPSFLDAILNIAESDTSSSLEHQDNWVYQLKHHCNNTIHFFGDDTWIRLFPGLFTKQDGTTSFYVSDTVQVDLNVTRHIQTDMTVPDWNTMILHYLGLDHVGHLGGPKSPLMKPKQEEMDRALEQIYQLVAEQDSERIVKDANAKGTLIVVCGDHGMNEVGNHGGSSLEETSAALVFMSPRFESRPVLKKHSTRELPERPSAFGFPIIDQIDLVPTLASVLGFPIPKNNLGKVIVDLYRGDKDSSILRALQLNAYQLGQLLSKSIPEPSKNTEEYSVVFGDNSRNEQGYARAVALHKQALDDIKNEQATETALNAYLEQLLAALLSLSQLPLLRLAAAWTQITPLVCPTLKWHLLALSLMLPVVLAVRALTRVGQSKRLVDLSGSAGIIQTMCKVVLGEWSDVPRMYKTILELGVLQQLDQVELGKLIYNYGGATLLMLNAVIYVSKRATLLNVGKPNDDRVGSFLHILLYTSTPILLLISRSQNAFLFSVYAVQFYLLEQWQRSSMPVPVPPWLLGAIVTLFSQAAFFCTGHSNSIASVDLSSSYIGVDGYDPLVIGLLTFCSNWAGSLWWVLAGWVLVTEERDADVDADAELRWWNYSVTLSAVSGSFLVALSLSVTLLREHLFIWTVFSPKYLYQVAWTCLFHWFVHMFVGSIVVRIWFPWSQRQHSEEIDESNDADNNNGDPSDIDIDHGNDNDDDNDNGSHGNYSEPEELEEFDELNDINEL
ncbi:alkaline-phosphatase-like protein, partial [Phycomyces blakesleeanus]